MLEFRRSGLPAPTRAAVIAAMADTFRKSRYVGSSGASERRLPTHRERLCWSLRFLRLQGDAQRIVADVRRRRTSEALLRLRDSMRAHAWLPAQQINWGGSQTSTARRLKTAFTRSRLGRRATS